LRTLQAARPSGARNFPRDRGLDALGGSLAKDLAKRDLAGAALFCRQPRAALVGVAARDALAARGATDLRVVLDLRGIRDAEYLMTLGKDEKSLTPVEKKKLSDYRVQEELACRRADAVLTVSRAMERLVEQRYGLDDSKVGRVPNHAEPVPNAETLRVAARAELGVAEGALLVMYSGTLAGVAASRRVGPSLPRTEDDAPGRAALLPHAGDRARCRHRAARGRRGRDRPERAGRRGSRVCCAPRTTDCSCARTTRSTVWRVR